MWNVERGRGCQNGNQRTKFLHDRLEFYSRKCIKFITLNALDSQTGGKGASGSNMFHPVVEGVLLCNQLDLESRKMGKFIAWTEKKKDASQLHIFLLCHRLVLESRKMIKFITWTEKRMHHS